MLSLIRAVIELAAVLGALAEVFKDCNSLAEVWTALQAADAVALLRLGLRVLLAILGIVAAVSALRRRAS